MVNYRTLIGNINNRYNPESLSNVQKNLDRIICGIDGDVKKYVRLAMNEVDPFYTQKTLDAGECVKKHLEQGLPYFVDFAYQGSVMTRTHIRGVSDIDLLTFAKEFSRTDYAKAKSYVESNQFSMNPAVSRVQNWLNSFSLYTGDAEADLRRLRLDDEKVLKSKYAICDTSKPKSIRITNQHLHRDVDVVVASWHDSLDFIKGAGDEYRGIYIYDKDENESLGPDFPFLSIKRINDRSALTDGRLKKMIRFLKNVKADSTLSIDLSSFDINAICYDIDVDDYKYLHYLALVPVIWLKLHRLCTDSLMANNLKSVDGSEYIFRNKPSKIENLKRLENEVWKIYNEIKL